MAVFDSTLSSFQWAYPDEARHNIQISIIHNAEPQHILLDPIQYKLDQDNLAAQLERARAFQIALEGQKLYKNHVLIAENRTCKIKISKNTVIYLPDGTVETPFMSHIRDRPELVHHYEMLHPLVTLSGDYMLSVIDRNYGPNTEDNEENDTDSVEEHNILNAMEG